MISGKDNSFLLVEISLGKDNSFLLVEISLD